MSANESAYARIRGDENGDAAHDDSSTDVDESAPSRRPEEKSCRWDEYVDSHAPRPIQRRWRQCCSSMLLQGLLNTVLLLLVLALLLDRRWHRERHGQLEGSGDITGFIPPVSQQIKSFVPDMAFAPENASEFFSAAVKKKWLSIVPKGLGYLKVDNPSDYNNLPHPVEGYKDIVFTTSVTHQLHCLYNILEVYSSLTSGRTIDKQMEGHLPHCFEYLRQSIMCCGDTALEGQHTTFPDDIIGSDGWDAKHVCKDYGQIYEYLEKNRADNQVWI